MWGIRVQAIGPGDKSTRNALLSLRLSKTAFRIISSLYLNIANLSLQKPN